MPGPKVQRKWPYTRSGWCRVNLGSQGTSVLAVALSTVNVATACYPLSPGPNVQVCDRVNVGSREDLLSVAR